MGLVWSWVAPSPAFPTKVQQLWQAVEEGAPVGEVKRRMEEMTREEVETRDERGRSAVHRAVGREEEVLEVVLDGIGVQALAGTYEWTSPLELAVWKHGKGKVTMILAKIAQAKRERKEEEETEEKEQRKEGEKEEKEKKGEKVCQEKEEEKKEEKEEKEKKEEREEKEEKEETEREPMRMWTSHCRLMNRLTENGVTDETLVDMVADAIEEDPRATHIWSHVLFDLLEASSANRYAVATCLRRGGVMIKERLKERGDKFFFVHLAARRQDAAMVRMVLEAVPGEGTEADYAKAIDRAIMNRRHRERVVELLVQEGQVQLADVVSPQVVAKMRRREDMEMVLRLAPELVVQACGEKYGGRLLGEVMRRCSEEATEAYVEAVRELEEREAVARQLARVEVEFASRDCSWRWKLRPLFEKVPEAWQGRVGKWLMVAVKRKAYSDVEFLLSLCSRAELALRNEDGDQAADVARRDKEFPKQLLARMTVVTKNAYS